MQIVKEITQKVKNVCYESFAPEGGLVFCFGHESKIRTMFDCFFNILREV
jgi:hypothetical protein